LKQLFLNKRIEKFSSITSNVPTSKLRNKRIKILSELDDRDYVGNLWKVWSK